MKRRRAGDLHKGMPQYTKTLVSTGTVCIALLVPQVLVCCGMRAPTCLVQANILKGMVGLQRARLALADKACAQRGGDDAKGKRRCRYLGQVLALLKGIGEE